MNRSRPDAEALETRELMTAGAGESDQFTGPYALSHAVTTGGDGNLYVANSGYDGNGSIDEVAPDGTLLATDPLSPGEGADAIVTASDGII